MNTLTTQTFPLMEINTTKTYAATNQYAFRAFGFVVLLLCSMVSFGQTTYTWAGGATASWAVAASWSPTRTTPANNDILQFNAAGTFTATVVPNQTIGRLLVSGGATVNLQSAAAVTLTISGGAAALSVASGSTLNSNGTFALTINVPSTGSSTGTIAGSMTFSLANHRLTAGLASGITFSGSATFVQGTGCTGSVFGFGTNGSIVFATGTTFRSQAGGSPFGSAAPAATVVFNSGSTYSHEQTASADGVGRTYGNFINVSGTNSPGGIGTLTVLNNITCNGGVINLNVTSIIIGGDVIANGGTVNLTPASGGSINIAGNVTSNNVASSNIFIAPATVPGLVTFDGTGAQTITRSTLGGLTFSVRASVVIANTSAPVTFSTLSSAVTGLLTVNAGAILATSVLLTTSGAVAVNGTFRINQGGFATGAGVWTYGASSTLNFANTTIFGFENAHVFWPTLNGPPNVNISGTGGVNIGNGSSNASRTVPGTFQTSSGVTLSGGSVLTLNGTNQINSGGFFNNSPEYGGSATLVYNTGATFGRGNELVTGISVPANITINAGSSLDYGNGATGTARTLTGNLIANGGFFMDFGSNDMTQPLTVNGNVSIGTAGSLSLSDAGGGDISVGGNWTIAGSGAFNPKSRAVSFISTGTSTITTATAASFDFLVVNKTGGGSVVLANNATVNNSFTLTNGVVTTSTNTLTASGSVARTNGWVNGRLQKAASTSAVTYEVGDATNYTPAIITASSTTGSIIVASKTGVATNLTGGAAAFAALTLSQSNRLDRFYSVSQSGFSGNYTGVFTYISTNDVTGTITAANVRSGVNTTGTTWVYPGQVTASGGSAPSLTVTSASTASFGDVVFAMQTVVNVTSTAGQSKVFGAANPTYSFATSPVVSTTGALGRVAGENVATSPYNYTIGTLASADPNYTLNLVAGESFAITAAVANVTPTTGQSKVFGAGNPTYTFATNPVVSTTGALSRDAGENVATSPYNYTIGTLASADPNYTLNLVAGESFAITALAITVTPNPGQSKVFGAGNPTYTYTNLPALISPDVFTGALSRDIGEAVGTYAYTLGNLTAGSNYSLSQGGSNSFTINGIGESIADFRSKSPGGNFSLASTWEYDLGGNNFTNASAAPNSTNNVSVIHAVTLNQNFTVGSSKSLTLGTGGTLVVNPTRTLTITGSADFGGNSVTFKSDGTGTASLGQVAPGALTGATNVTVERFIPNNNFRSWRLLSVPTTGGQTINSAWQEGNAPLANGTPNHGTQITGPVAGNGLDAVSQVASMLSWNGTGFVGISNTNASIANNKSYFLYIRGERAQGITGAITSSSATTLRTNGTVYTGLQTFTVGSSNQFGLIANLYPSAIDLISIGATGFTPRYYYIWDSKIQSGNSLGVYKTIDADGGFSVTGPGGGSYGATNRIIESGQSFFVQTNNAVGTVTINENAKIAGSANGSLGLRPSTPVAAIAKLRSTLISLKGSSSVADQNVVKFDNAYPNTVDQYDALKFNNAGENFGILRDTKTLVIEGRQPVSVADTIYYRMWNMQPQAYQIQFEPTNLGGSGLIAVLEDKYLQKSTIVDLTITNNVNFTVDANAGSSASDRFKIVFKQLAPLPVSFISITAIRSTNGTKVNWKVAAENGIARYEVERSADGRSFNKIGTVAGATQDQYTFTDVEQLAVTSFYRIKSIGLAGDVKYSSIVKLTAGNVKPGYSISPNPAEGNLVNLQFKNQSAGSYQISISTVVGQRLFTSVVAHSGGSSTQVLNITRRLAAGTYQLEIIATDKSRQAQSLVVKANN